MLGRQSCSPSPKRERRSSWTTRTIPTRDVIERIEGNGGRAVQADIPKPEEVAALAVYLASAYVTGSTFFTDGGMIRHAGSL